MKITKRTNERDLDSFKLSIVVEIGQAALNRYRYLRNSQLCFALLRCAMMIDNNI